MHKFFFLTKKCISFNSLENNKNKKYSLRVDQNSKWQVRDEP
jgi:hypothetical protein